MLYPLLLHKTRNWSLICQLRINVNKVDINTTKNIHEAAFPSFHQQSPILYPHASRCNCLWRWQSPYDEHYVENPPVEMPIRTRMWIKTNRTITSLVANEPSNHFPRKAWTKLKLATNLQIDFPELFEVGIEAHDRPTRRNNHQNLPGSLSGSELVDNPGSHCHGASAGGDADFVRQQAHLRKHASITESFIHTPTMRLQNLMITITQNPQP